jgi:hypothetical protein
LPPRWPSSARHHSERAALALDLCGAPIYGDDFVMKPSGRSSRRITSYRGRRYLAPSPHRRDAQMAPAFPDVRRSDVHIQGDRGFVRLPSRLHADLCSAIRHSVWCAICRRMRSSGRSWSPGRAQRVAFPQDDRHSPHRPDGDGRAALQLRVSRRR